MGKGICSGIVILLFVSAMLVSCASVPWSSPTPLTSKDLPSLKGKWVGRTIFGSFESSAGGQETPTELEIYNDTLPIEGTITFLTLPRYIWDDLPPGIKGGPTGQGAVIPFKKGRLSNKGYFALVSGENSLTLNLYNEGGKLRLEGTVLFVAYADSNFIQGDVMLNKK